MSICFVYSKVRFMFNGKGLCGTPVANFRGTGGNVEDVDVLRCPVSQSMSSHQTDPAVSEVWTQSK